MTADLAHAYTELFVLGDENGGEFAPRFECSVCDRTVDDEPCPDHAPLGDLPGLRLLDCDAQPRHWVWVHQRDDYGMPCPQCLLTDYARLAAEARQCRHWGWRRSRVTRWLAVKAYVLGVIAGYGVDVSGDGHDGCVGSFHLSGRRPYVLGVSRRTWRCWLQGRHRRGEPVGFGFCGKCVPWPCCGAETVDHADGCAEAVSW